MPKYKVGDRFKVVESDANADDLQVGKILVLAQILPVSSREPTQFYGSSYPWQWNLEETEIPNQLIVVGLSRILAVLSKIEEPDT